MIEAPDGGCYGLLYGQQSANTCSSSNLGFDANAATVRFKDTADNGQTESGALGFRRAQDGCKRPPLQFLTHALAGVLELHRQMRRPFVRARLMNGT